ncbi:distal tail protein Dit [Thermaerobacter marianensis]|uniref:distal tail protein Dit n=1 Tax=Thermaerobacter marianensis TaxID=73919 RepID=UPI00145D8F2E|nr:distal tail protein Dit [Thermaerobacter marianensis]
MHSVTDVRRSILPPVTARTLDTPGRPGVYYQGFDYGAREIQVDIILAESTLESLRSRVRNLAAWLRPDDTPRPLVFDDEPELTWYAVLSGDTNLEEIVTVGRGTLTFLCPEPYAIGPERVLTIADGATVTAQGTADTYPIIRATVQRDITFLSIGTVDRYVLLGTPSEVEQASVPPYERIMSDELTTTEGWVDGLDADGGLVAGTMTSNGNEFVVADYGIGSGWHGPALQKGLPELVQDFRVTMWVQAINGKAEVGRVEAYLLDQTGAIIGKIGLADKYAGRDEMWGIARAGNLANGTYIINEYGDRRGVWNDFYGVLRIGRVGNTWEAYIAKYDPVKRVYHTRRLRRWTDTKGRWTAPLARVQLHAGAYGENPPMSVRILSVTVERVNKLQLSDVPIIAGPGDEIEIDCERFAVRLNGEHALELLDPSSQFFVLRPGEPVTFDVSPPGAATVELRYRERWL